MGISSQISIQDMATIPWDKIYDFVLSSGSVHNLKGFSKEIIHQIGQLIPFDQARIYFQNGNGRLSDQYLVGIDKKWATAYHEYYSKIEGGRYGIPSQVKESQLPLDGHPMIRYIGYRTWLDAPNDEFVRDYIRPMGLSYSLGFTLFDTDGMARTHFMLDRTTPIRFSERELLSLNVALPQLNNLHKNFFSQNSNEQKIRGISWEATGLTAREIEIANLLCHGVKPANISDKLHITQATTYKHIAHIYEKMHVSSKQELLVKLLNN